MNVSIEGKKMQTNLFQVVLGSVLGDGHIEQLKSGSCRLEIKHALDQYEYIRWKEKLLSCLRPTVTPREDKRDNRQDVFVLRTPVDDFLKFFRKRFYGKDTHQTSFSLKYVKHINSLGFLIWYLDDGSLSKNGAMSISVERASHSDRTMLAKLMSDKFDVKFRVNKKGIRLTKADTAKLLEQLRKDTKGLDVPVCMQYKLAA